jgi:hypothetical protein
MAVGNKRNFKFFSSALTRAFNGFVKKTHEGKGIRQKQGGSGEPARCDAALREVNNRRSNLRPVSGLASGKVPRKRRLPALNAQWLLAVP